MTKKKRSYRKSGNPLISGNLSSVNSNGDHGLGQVLQI
jgi:hypothetical protein